jgi:hypothetical protein
MKMPLFNSNSLFRHSVFYGTFWLKNDKVFICNNVRKLTPIKTIMNMASGVSKPCTKFIKCAQTQIILEPNDN